MGTSDGAISGGPKTVRNARAAVGCFFGVFLVVGVGASGAVLGLPALRMVDALDWTPTTCEIVSSRVRETPVENGSTYRVEVSYRYIVDGQPHTGTRYKFAGGATSGRRRKAEAVQRLSPGTRVGCYVNPSNPTESVIVRGPTGDLVYGLIPLFFAVIGSYGIWGSRGPLRRMSPQRVPTHMTYGSPPERGRFTRLVPLRSRATKAGGLALFALFWNAVVAVFVYQIVDSWRQGSFVWFLAVFMVPFVLVGGLLVVVATMKLLAYFNPMTHLTASSQVLALGDELKLRWVIEGRAERLRRLYISVIGREEVTYRRGTDTRTDTAIFTLLPLVHQSAPVSTHGGKVAVTIPPTTMHSFEAPNNRIVWCVRVRGDMINWPDIEDEFVIHVTPAR